MNKSWLLFIASLIFIEGCGGSDSSGPDKETQALTEARNKWQENTVEHHQMDQSFFCFCARPEGIVSVSNNEIVHVIPAVESLYVPEGNQQNLTPDSYYTVEGLFEVVESALEQSPDTLIVDYDEEFGFPKRIVIDQDREVDGGFTVLVRNFTPLSIELTDIVFSTWTLLSYGNKSEPISAIPGFEPTIHFDLTMDQIFGNTTCNIYSSDLQINTEGDITLSNTSTTEVACEHQQQEADFLTALGQITSWEFRDDHLYLEYSNGENQLVFAVKE